MRRIIASHLKLNLELVDVVGTTIQILQLNLRK